MNCSEMNRTVDVPVCLLRVFLEICRKENILGLDTMELLCHRFGVPGQVNEVMFDMRRIALLLTSREGVNSLPGPRVFAKRSDYLAT